MSYRGWLIACTVAFFVGMVTLGYTVVPGVGPTHWLWAVAFIVGMFVAGVLIRAG